MQSHLDGDAGGATGLTLDLLASRMSAEIIAVDGDDTLSQRLADHGLWPGVRVTLLARAPFGDPLLVLVQGSRLAIRREEAHRVRVQPVEER